jgi:GTPase SAR1 family protein
LIQLKLIEQELELIIGFPEIYSKKIIAVSGGFSSGKSEFVNSFINDKAIQLAVGIQPMTAIPTYVIASQKTSVKGYSVNGGSIHLDIGTYKSISHDFMKELGFDLKKLMPFMSLGVDMDEELFKDICLIDTPGYNPSKTGSTDDDSKTASHYVGQADALIWVIGLDSNGTISTSDLDFIKNLNLGEKPLFFVLNKADLRSEDDIQSILDEVANTLDDEDINFTGICSYSSFTKQILVYDRINVHDFIKEINISSSVHHDLYVKIDQIFDHYQNSIEHDIKVRKDIVLKMKSIRLDILETNHEDLYKRTENRFGEMSPGFDTVKLEQNLLDLYQLREAFKQAIIMTTRDR